MTGSPFIPDSLEHAIEDVEHAIDGASFDPRPAGDLGAEPRRWWGHHLSELRWQAELVRLLVDPVYFGRGVPHGDGAPVLLIPGFLAGDVSLSVLRDWLRRIGYEPHASGMQFNVGCSERAVAALDDIVARVHARTGRRVALIGHSRGGHFAKALGHRRPDLVSRVISMGAGLDTPFDISIPTKAAVAAARSVLARTTDRVARHGCLTETCRCAYTHDYADAFPREIPLTSIYSRGDGVVWWEACTVPYARNVEVSGSHVGLPFNRRVYRAVAKELAAPAAV